MRILGLLFFVSLSVSCPKEPGVRSPTPMPTSTPEAVLAAAASVEASPSQAFSGRWLSAPQGMSLQDLGRPFTADFQRIQGTSGANLFPEAGAPLATKQNLMKHETVLIDDEQMFFAQAGAWGVEGSIEASSAQRYASYRAMIVTEVYELNDTTAMRKAPKDAVYYPARLYVGHMYEVVVSGSEESFDANVAADLIGYGGEIDAFAKKHSLKIQAIGRGLKPTSSKAIFARTELDIESSYAATSQDAVPIMVEWRVLPEREAPFKKIAWRSLKEGCAGERGCAPCKVWSFNSISYTAPSRQSNGDLWDADGSSPDLSLSLAASGDTRVLPKKEDSASGSWTLAPALQVKSGDNITLTALDIDLWEHDTIAELKGRAAEFLEGGVLTFGTGSASLSGVCKNQ